MYAIILAASLLGVLGQFSLVSNPVPAFESVYVISGQCKLMLNEVDHTFTCGERLIRIVYLDGRRSYAFSEGGDTLISMSGVREETSEGADILLVDHLTLATQNGRRVDAENARGKCTLSAADQRHVRLQCIAQTQSINVQASFVGDGEFHRTQP